MLIAAFEFQSSSSSVESLSPTNIESIHIICNYVPCYTVHVPELLTCGTVIDTLHSKQAFILLEQPIINIFALLNTCMLLVNNPYTVHTRTKEMATWLNSTHRSGLIAHQTNCSKAFYWLLLNICAIIYVSGC